MFPTLCFVLSKKKTLHAVFICAVLQSITNLTRSAKNTDNPNVVLELGKAHMAAGQFATARQCFNKALAIQVYL